MSISDPGAGGGHRRRWILALAAAAGLVALVLVAVFPSWFLAPSPEPPGAPPVSGEVGVAGRGESSGGSDSAGPAGGPPTGPPPRAATVPDGGPSPLEEEAAPVELPPDRINILLMGVDQRPDQVGVPSRSDSIILVSVDPESKRVAMISIPRDLYVEIPGFGYDRIGHSHAFGDAQGYAGGGPALVRDTVEHNFGVEIDYYAQVEFDGFKRLVDTLGGVTVDVERPVLDPDHPSNVAIPTGVHHLDGDDALIFARSRYGDNDFGRSERQQRLLLAILDKAATLESVPKLPSLLGTLQDMVDTDIPPLEMLRLARLATEVDRDRVTTLLIGPEYVTPFTGPRGEALLDPNFPKIRRAMALAMTEPPATAQTGSQGDQGPR